jgi:hypothetical protein
MSTASNIEWGDNPDWTKWGHDDTGVETPEEAARMLASRGMTVADFKTLVVYGAHRAKWDGLLPKE